MAIVIKVEDYKCPKCGARSQDGDSKGNGTHVTATPALFTGDPPFNAEPGLWWLEVHHCKCGQLYCFENGA